MKKRVATLEESQKENVPPSGLRPARVARIVRIDDGGRPWVDLADGRRPQMARLARALARTSIALSEVPPLEVLVAFDSAGRPVVVDFVEDRMSGQAAGAAEAATSNEEMIIDADRMTFDAKEQLTFRCGKASVTLTRAGKVIIRGAYVSSSSTGVHRINGGSVQIN